MVTHKLGNITLKVQNTLQLQCNNPKSASEIFSKKELYQSMTVEISERINKIHVLKVTDLKINSHLFTGFTPIIIKMQVHSYVTKKKHPWVCLLSWEFSNKFTYDLSGPI